MNNKKIFLWLIGILFVIVLSQNTQVVSFRFLFWQLSMSRIILVSFVLLGGFVMGFIVGKKS